MTVEQCFYCRGMLSKGNRELDHFPRPARHGGTEVVPACRTCHDMKDRFNASDWPVEFIGPIMRDIENSSREMRIFFAKAASVMFDAIEFNKNKDGK